MRQLGLDGRETEHPVVHPRPLTERQRELVLWMRLRGVVRPIEVGAIMHAGRDVPLRRGAERHPSSDGVDALKRLEARGLVERVARGQWRLLRARRGGLGVTRVRRQWIDADRLVLVVELDDGTLTVATRPEVDAVWGPPVRLELDIYAEAWRRRTRPEP